MAMQTFDDNELDAVPTKTAGKTNGHSKPQPQPQPAAATEEDDLNESDVEFGTEQAEEFRTAIDLLPAVKVTKGDVARFAFVPGYAMKHARVHYKEGVGSYRCLSVQEKRDAKGNITVAASKGICCEGNSKEAFAKDRFAALVFSYGNADVKTGKFPTGTKVPQLTVKAVRLSRSNFKDCSDLPREDETVYGIDIWMRHDESRAFGYKFNAAGPAAWKRIEAEALKLAEPFKDGTAVARKLGKKLNAIELKLLLSGQTQKPEDVSLADINDIQ
jgi:hypothetical protein